jgi:hypothetical protein
MIKIGIFATAAVSNNNIIILKWYPVIAFINSSVYQEEILHKTAITSGMYNNTYIVVLQKYLLVVSECLRQ